MVNHKHSSQAAVGAAIGEKVLRDNGSGAIAFSYTATSQTKVLNVRLGATSAPSSAGSLVMTVSSPTQGAEFACTVLSLDMVSNTSISYTEPVYLNPNDVLTISYANTDSVTYGLTVVYADLGVN